MKVTLYLICLFAVYITALIPKNLDNNNEMIVNKIAPSTEQFNTNDSQILDWRTKGKVLFPMYQGDCDSCWAFAAASMLESNLAIQVNTTTVTRLSQQQLIDCGNDYGNAGCLGGTVFGALDYVSKQGICPYSKYPYSGVTKQCRINNKTINHSPDPEFRCGLSSYLELDNRQNDTKQSWTRRVLPPARGFVPNVSLRWKISKLTNEQIIKLLQTQTLGIAIDGRYLPTYTGGIMPATHCDSQAPNHAMVLIGYNLIDKYWIIKNSWGTGWGVSGFLSLQMTENSCGLNNAVIYTVLSQN